MGAGLCCSDISKAQPYSQEAYVAPMMAPAGPNLQPQNDLSPDSKAVASSAAVPPAAAGPDLAAAANEREEGEPDKFISTVGELPTFSAPSREDGGSGSEAGSIDGVSDMYDSMAAKEQQKQAKKVVKDFVKEMVRGKKMNVMKQSGQLTSCQVSLTRALDMLKIKAGGQTRDIMLKEIAEIVAGTEVQDIDTPLDELCATLMLVTEDCITFRMVDMNSRDTFIMCLLMFCNNQR